MGGTTFDTSALRADVNEAFQECREQAGYEHGHGGYSGTIQEKHEFTVITQTPLPLSAAEVLAEKLINEDDSRIRDKWGPAGAIPFFNTDTPANTRIQTLKLTLPGGLDWTAKDAAVAAEVAKQVTLKPNETVIGTRVLSDTAGPAKVKAEATKGKAVTKYTVPNTPHAAWQTGLATQAEARAAAVDYANRETSVHHNRNDIEVYEVVPVTRREGGEPLVKVTRTVSKHTVMVEVSILKESSLNKVAPDGWLFFGWASC